VVTHLAATDPQEITGRQWDGAAGGLGFDVGANAGQSVAQMVGLFGHVVAFEPAWESFKIMATAYTGDPRVTLRRVAVSDQDGKVDLAVRQAPIITGQLVTPGMPYHGEHMDEPNMAHWGADITLRTVRCITLDTAANEHGMPDFIKVDTEGHEVKVLSGARKLLASGHPGWLVEFHDKPLREECVRIFEANGYQVEMIWNPTQPEGSYMWERHGWMRARPQGGK
jgi:FkbM family methyltransferase